jgi:2'-5' RNA ligase
MRLFIAVPLPPDVVRAVYAAQTALMLRGAEGRFVPKRNYHITLHFIGESDALSDAAEAMHEAARDIHPFLLRLGEYGGFGGERGRTAFLSVLDGTGELNRLHEALESALWEHGFSHGRGRFSPHITLGRNIVKDEGFLLPKQTAAFTANVLTLYESRNEAGQMRYTALHKEPLS